MLGNWGWTVFSSSLTLLPVIESCISESSGELLLANFLQVQIVGAFGGSGALLEFSMSMLCDTRGVKILLGFSHEGFTLISVDLGTTIVMELS